MGYTELEDVKSWLKIKDTVLDDDPVLLHLIDVATEMIDQYCRRKLVTTQSTTRYYWPDAVVNPSSNIRNFDLSIPYVYNQLQWRVLKLDDYLLSIDSGGLVNGNGQVLPDDSYNLEPLNNPPYRWIRLKSSYTWQWTVDGKIAVTGIWGKRTDVPATIRQACTELTAYLYRSRSVSQFDSIGNADIGQMGTPVTVYAIPANIRNKLESYKSRKIL